jgi:diaminobutyrate-2-oxoglutarate transaminase
LLIAPQLDKWAPGEFTGTFRGFTYSFVTAAEALRQFWSKPAFVEELAVSGARLGRLLDDLSQRYQAGVRGTRQLGLFAGVNLASSSLATRVQRRCFERGLLVETCGPDAATVKLLPPITISPEDLCAGVEILAEALDQGSHAG